MKRVLLLLLVSSTSLFWATGCSSLNSHPRSLVPIKDIQVAEMFLKALQNQQVKFPHEDEAGTRKWRKILAERIAWHGPDIPVTIYFFQAGFLCGEYNVSQKKLRLSVPQPSRRIAQGDDRMVISFFIKKSGGIYELHLDGYESFHVNTLTGDVSLYGIIIGS